MIKSTVKKILPHKTKLRGKLAIRYCNDILNGNYSRFAKKGIVESKKFQKIVEIEQPILDSKVLKNKQNKVYNIKEGAKAIEKIVIEPGEVFSFWRAVGKPSKGNGYKEGINIIAGKIQEGFGGGLCQLASIIYHATLKIGLETIERYNHSIDLYHNEARYTPLGSDAAVFYGYKDLRVKNILPYPIKFQFKIKDNQVSCLIFCTFKIPVFKIDFEITEQGIRHSKVLTKQNIDNKIKVISESKYKINISV